MGTLRRNMRIECCLRKSGVRFRSQLHLQRRAAGEAGPLRPAAKLIDTVMTVLPVAGMLTEPPLLVPEGLGSQRTDGTLPVEHHLEVMRLPLVQDDQVNVLDRKRRPAYAMPLKKAEQMHIQG